MAGASLLKAPLSPKADVWLHVRFKNYEDRRAGQKQSKMEEVVNGAVLCQYSLTVEAVMLDLHYIVLTDVVHWSC